MHPIRRFKPGEEPSEEDILWNPQILYHYTTREGLIGILSSATVWATSIRFLNDASEYSYAQSMLVEKLREIRSRLTEPEHSSQLDQALHHLSDLTPHLFVFCLSRRADLLSQWRAYGQPGNGYAIGFDAPELDKIIRKQNGMQLAAVCYEPEQQRDLIDRVEIAAATRNPSRAENIRSYGKSLGDVFLNIGPLMKDPAFTEESEWRLVWRLDSKDVLQVKHRAGRSMLVPYVSIGMETEAGPLPIVKIVIGPNPHPDLEEEAVKGLCRQCGIMADVQHSTIPYRVV